jgi:hypothetical protein
VIFSTGVDIQFLMKSETHSLGSILKKTFKSVLVQRMHSL